ncbi:MAG TPA: hypothetical protein VFS97_08700 [Nitrososphaeraceae archaeon]|nr:hypothetical protein [Nitrososphaeraceae archaeon]
MRQIEECNWVKPPKPNHYNLGLPRTFPNGAYDDAIVAMIAYDLTVISAKIVRSKTIFVTTP